jgi:hypothetical protein
MGQFQMQFHFDEDIKIYVENTFVYYTGDAQTCWRSGELSGAAAPLKLLGKAVQKVEVEAPSALWLHFANEGRLAVIDDSREYESFTVTRPGFTLWCNRPPGMRPRSN